MYTPYVSWRGVPISCPVCPGCSPTTAGRGGAPKYISLVSLLGEGGPAPQQPSPFSLALPRSRLRGPRGPAHRGSRPSEPPSRSLARANTPAAPRHAQHPRRRRLMRGRSSLQPAGLGPPDPVGGAGVVVDGAQRHRRRRPHGDTARQQREESPLDRVDQLVPPARCGAVRCGVVWCGVVWCGVVQA